MVCHTTCDMEGVFCLPVLTATVSVTVTFCVEISLHFAGDCDSLVFLFLSPFYSMAHSAENHASKSGFKYLI